jgi:hypothetical protein
VNADLKADGTLEGLLVAVLVGPFLAFVQHRQTGRDVLIHYALDEVKTC